jgi:hypothetical protein
MSRKKDNTLVLILSLGKIKFKKDDQIKNLAGSFEEKEASFNCSDKYIYIVSNKKKEINEAIMFILLYAIELLEVSKEINLIDFFSELEQNSSVFFIQQKQISEENYSKELASTIDNVVDKITKTFFELFNQ